jgi:hypothetical protein
MQKNEIKIPIVVIFFFFLLFSPIMSAHAIPINVPLFDNSQNQIIYESDFINFK